MAQSVNVQFELDSRDNNLKTYSLEQAGVQFGDRYVTVTPEDNSSQSIGELRSGSLSESRGFLGVLYAHGELRTAILDGKGSRINETAMEYADPADETLRLWVFNDGRFVMRDNIANFTFFDANGSRKYSLSNLSGSPDGEVVSELHSDPSGRTVLLTVPRVNHRDQEGSIARIVEGEDDLRMIYQNRDRTISHASVSADGSMILLATAAEGSDDRILVFDRFGNEIARIDSGEELQGASLSENSEYVTLYSTSRVQVYELPDGERIASSTIRRGSVFFADYSSRDQQVVLLSGRESSKQKQFADPEIQVIHLGERAIARGEVGSPLSYLNRDRVRLERLSENMFSIRGLNRVLRIQAAF